MTSGGNFKVAVRVRPLIERERKEVTSTCINVEAEQGAVVIKKPPVRSSIHDISATGDNSTTQTFFFDTVFNPSSDQLEIYNVCAQHIVMSVLEGYNGSIIAYGQTGTGKSYTIEGDNSENVRGIIPRASEDIFKYIQNTASVKDRFLVRVSYLEIYNERISDLLDPSLENLRIRGDGSGGVHVEGLSEHVVRKTDEIYKLIHQGAHMRTTAETRMNKESSRSHAVFTIIVEHAEYGTGGGSIVTIGKLRLVDLAGSEKIDSDALTQRKEETKNINLSLHVFGKVVTALTTSSQHIPYRDSKLTRILQDSLGGNCKTTLITTITPVNLCYTESLNSLKFAKRAKNVKNNAVINKDISQKALLSAYQDEIKKLRQQLQDQGGNQIEELEKNMQEAQLEKAKVLSKLEMQQELYSKAEQEKQSYLSRITELEHMLIHGGSTTNTETKEFKKAVAEEREKIIYETEVEYRKKVEQLEEERKKLQYEREEIIRQKNYMSKLQGDFKKSTSTLHKLDKDIQSVNQHQLSQGATIPPILPSTLPSRRVLDQKRPLGYRSLPTHNTWATPVIQPTPEHSIYTSSIEEALYQYSESLSHPLTGIPSQQLQSGVRIFTGSDAIKWFANNMEGITSLEIAQQVGQRLIDLNMISEIEGGNTFIASNVTYYQFTEQLPNPTRSSRPNSAFSLISLPTQPVGRVTLNTSSLPNVHSSEYSSTNSLEESIPQILETYQLEQLSPTTLHIAAISGNRTQLKELVQKEGNVDVEDRGGNTPLMYAAIHGCCKVVLLLIQLGANINLQNFQGHTAVMLGTIHQHDDVVKSLLKNGAETSRVDCNGDTIFHFAARNNSSRNIEILLKYANNLKPLNQRNLSYHSPLHAAVVANIPQNIATLVKKGKIDVGTSDTEGKTALHYAVRMNYMECVREIIDAAPKEINLIDINGYSPLHIACEAGLTEIAMLITSSPRCLINLADDAGRTPLHVAVLANQPEIVQLLLNKGADASIKDTSKTTALEYSQDNNLKNCTKQFHNYDKK